MSKSDKIEEKIVEEYTIETTGKPRDRISKREFDALQEVKKVPEIAAYGLSDKQILIFMFPMKFELER